jgi:Ser/Thr protein kinase RdoA (MazF antagonist)
MEANCADDSGLAAMSRVAQTEPELIVLLRRRHGERAVADAQRAVLDVEDSATGAALERIQVLERGTTTSYVVKRISPLGDWLARATDDRQMREYQLAVGGIFAELPAGVASATIGAARTRDGAVILMRDVSHGLPRTRDTLLTDEQVRRTMQALASVHSTCRDLPNKRAASLGLNTLERWLTPLAPRTARREEDRAPRDGVTPLILPGWAAFAALAPDAWRIIEPLLDDPVPLARLLRRFPATLVHGDAKATNVAVEDDCVVFLDWSTTTAGPGALDVAWYVCINALRLPFPRDDAIEIYRAERERLGQLCTSGESWQRELRLALLTSTMRLGWQKALGATIGDPVRREREREEVEYWAAAALNARALLDVSDVR